jgi:hypothetical protein
MGAELGFWITQGRQTVASAIKGQTSGAKIHSFKREKKTFVLIHGFGDTPRSIQTKSKNSLCSKHRFRVSAIFGEKSITTPALWHFHFRQQSDCARTGQGTRRLRPRREFAPSSHGSRLFFPSPAASRSAQPAGLRRPLPARRLPVLPSRPHRQLLLPQYR